MKLIKTLLIAGLLSSFASAATINITSGLTTQGVTVTSGGLATTGHFLAAGNWNGTLFTQFGAGIQDDAKINGQIIATSPTSLNGLPVHLFIGNGTSVETSTSYIIVGRTTSVLFPADVTGTGSATFSVVSGAVLTNQTSVNAEIVGNTINFTPIPEPSTALLGLLGIAGLIRRRR